MNQKQAIDTNAFLAVCSPALWRDNDGLARRLDTGTPVDWDALLALAHRHRVVPLVARRLLHLAESHAALLPQNPSFAADLRQSCALARIVEMRFLAELTTIWRAMAQAGVTMVLLKGLAVSTRAYGDLGLRTNRDIDLLVNPADLHIARKVLENLGLVMVEPHQDTSGKDLEAWLARAKDLVFCVPASGIIVELHQRLLDNPSFDLTGVVERSVPLCLPGKVEVRALDPIDEIKYLALHGALHGWSRLKWLLDLLWLTQGWSDQTMASLTQPPTNRSSIVATRAALSLGHQLFCDAKDDRRDTLRVRILVRFYRRVMLDNGDTEIENSHFGTTLKNMAIYFLVTNGVQLRERLAFDLTMDVQKGKYPRKKAIISSFIRVPEWLWRHLFLRHDTHRPHLRK